MTFYIYFLELKSSPLAKRFHQIILIHHPKCFLKEFIFETFLPESIYLYQTGLKKEGEKKKLLLVPASRRVQRIRPSLPAAIKRCTGLLPGIVYSLK
jgi:hypothetical protein